MKTCPKCNWHLSPNNPKIWPMNCTNPDCDYILDKVEGGTPDNELRQSDTV